MRQFFVMLSLLSAGPVAAANVIVDGGFETTPVPAAGLKSFSGGQIFGGAWQAIGDQITVVDSRYTEGSGPPITFNAHGGNHWLDLTGVGSNLAANGVAQNVVTRTGRLYTLQFYVGNADGVGSEASLFADPSTINLSIGGGPLVSFTNRTITPNAVNWQLFTSSFVAKGATTRIAFFNGTPSTDNAAGLDDVTLTAAVPEPASWGLMIGGFGLVGAAARRRRVTVAA